MCNKISTAICHLQTKKLDFNIFNRFDPIQVRRGSYMFQVSVCMASCQWNCIGIRWWRYWLQYHVRPGIAWYHATETGLNMYVEVAPHYSQHSWFYIQSAKIESDSKFLEQFINIYYTYSCLWHTNMPMTKICLINNL